MITFSRRSFGAPREWQKMIALSRRSIGQHDPLTQLYCIEECTDPSRPAVQRPEGGTGPSIITILKISKNICATLAEGSAGSGRGEAPNAAAANASNSSSPVCATTQAGFYTVPNWGNVTRWALRAVESFRAREQKSFKAFGEKCEWWRSELEWGGGGEGGGQGGGGQHHHQQHHQHVHAGGPGRARGGPERVGEQGPVGEGILLLLGTY